MSKEDKALGEFLNAFDERKRKETQKAALEIAVIEKKRKVLEPIRGFLQRFNELGLVVPDSESGNPGVPLGLTKKFTVYEGESSPTWAPGVSVFFDHPAQVEISVPNDSDIARHGAVVIRSVTSHKDKAMLHQKFATVGAAKDALARFLGKTAISIETDPRRRPKPVSMDKPDEALLSSAPKEPPAGSVGQEPSDEA